MRPLAEYIWINGELTPWADATIHVMSHALHYGTSVFEGIRVYDTPDGPRGFRLTDHVRRLFDSARMYHFKLPWTETELVEACKATVRATGLRSAYIRPIAFLGECGMGVTPGPGDMNIDVAIAAFPWGPIWARRRWRRASTPASPAGRASLRIPCRRAPRPAATICPAI